jgi:hypothetical protein
MAVSTYMLSLLGRQHLLLGGQFFDRYRSAWLVWESGPRRPSRSLHGNTEATLVPTSQTPKTMVNDAICFELKQSPEARVTVGRSSDNELVLNDLTVSRQQFVLEFINGLWRVRSLGTPLQVENIAVEPEGVVLKNGSVIAAGDVRMTFYSPEGFPTRLELENKKSRS